MFSETLYKLRNSHNLSQPELAKEINISTRTYQRYEKAEREPTMTVLIDLANVFDVSIDYLVGRTDDPKRY